MAISDWDEGERPREKLLAKGPDSLSDAELVAIFLRTGARGKTAVDLSREIIQAAGGLRALLGTDTSELARHPGLGPAKVAQLRALAEIARRVQGAKLEKGAVLASPAETRRDLQARMRDYKYEVFACLMLDNRHRVITLEELFRGTINGANVYPREVVRAVMRHNAAAVIFAHNHP